MSHLGVTQECDGQIDRQTEVHNCSKDRASLRCVAKNQNTDDTNSSNCNSFYSKLTLLELRIHYQIFSFI